MSTINYNPIFRVDIKHSFFTEGNCNCFDVALSKSTRLLTQQYGFKFEYTNGSIVCYSSESTNSVALLKYLKTKAVSFFDIKVGVTDDNFFNYTELPLNWLGVLCYDSEFEKNISEHQYAILTPEYRDSSDLQYLLTIRIHFDTLLNSCNHKEHRSEFRIEFKSRKSIWEYFVVDRTSVVSKETEIISESDVTFNKSAVMLFNGQLATKFASDTTIKLSQSPKYQFRLVNINSKTTGLNGEPNTDIIVPCLPSPSTSTINIMDFKGKKTVTSPMYIYV